MAAGHGDQRCDEKYRGHLLPRVVRVVDLVWLYAEHDAGCLHRQLDAVRRLSETLDLVIFKVQQKAGWVR